jgi:hypothetical protein
LTGAAAAVISKLIPWGMLGYITQTNTAPLMAIVGLRPLLFILLSVPIRQDFLATVLLKD